MLYTEFEEMAQDCYLLWINGQEGIMSEAEVSLAMQYMDWVGDSCSDEVTVDVHNPLADVLSEDEYETLLRISSKIQQSGVTGIFNLLSDSLSIATDNIDTLQLNKTSLKVSGSNSFAVDNFTNVTRVF